MAGNRHPADPVVRAGALMAFLDIKMRKLPSGGHRLLIWLCSPGARGSDMKTSDRDEAGWYGIRRIGDFWFERER